jgi:hypothetical protein
VTRGHSALLRRDVDSIARAVATANPLSSGAERRLRHARTITPDHAFTIASCRSAGYFDNLASLVEVEEVENDASSSECEVLAAR